MHHIEPHYGWEAYYNAANDSRSPFFGKEYNYELLTNDIYGYYINPAWDYIGSETLYIKLLFVDYKTKCAVIECIGEWNDTLHNDIMHLKRNVIDILLESGIKHYILIGENVFNFHGSDDCYYEEWFEDVEDGWIVSMGFRDFVLHEWRKYGIDAYINYGGELEIEAWRTLQPVHLCAFIHKKIALRLGM